MNKKLAFSVALLTLLFFAMVAPTFGATRMPGVFEQDQFIYTIVAYWNPANPNTPVPADLVTFNTTRWYNVTIGAISGENVSAEHSWVYKDGSQNSSFVIQDVNSGRLFVMKGMIDIVGTNLNANDFLYQSPNDLRRINETVSIDYGNYTRDTNAVHLSYPLTDSSGNPSGYGNTAYYFDRQTGVLVGRSDSTVDSTENVTITMLLKYTNRWPITAIPTIVSSSSNPNTLPPYALVAIIAAVIVIVVIVPVVFLRKRRSHKKRHRR